MEIKISDMIGYAPADLTEIPNGKTVSTENVQERVRHQLQNCPSVRTRKTAGRVLLLAAVMAVVLSVGVLAYNGLGYKHRKEYKAAVEWYEYCIEQHENRVQSDGLQPHSYFGAVNTDMEEKLLAIAESYQLSLPEPLWEAKWLYSMEDIYACTGVEAYLPEEAPRADTYGYRFNTGSFDVWSEAKLPDGQELLYQFQYAAYGSFHALHFFGPYFEPEQYERWNYTTEDGTRLSAMLSADYGGYLIIELEHGLMMVFLPSSSTEMMDRAAMELFAEQFDFAAMSRIG